MAGIDKKLRTLITLAGMDPIVEGELTWQCETKGER